MRFVLQIISRQRYGNYIWNIFRYNLLLTNIIKIILYTNYCIIFIVNIFVNTKFDVSRLCAVCFSLSSLKIISFD
jgi:hypothetical protein